MYIFHVKMLHMVCHLKHTSLECAMAGGVDKDEQSPALGYLSLAWGLLAARSKHQGSYIVRQCCSWWYGTWLRGWIWRGSWQGCHALGCPVPWPLQWGLSLAGPWRSVELFGEALTPVGHGAFQPKPLLHLSIMGLISWLPAGKPRSPTFLLINKCQMQPPVV